ncbi:glycosyltransferase [Halocatena pleomorpha]|uniref:Glycosyltransferase n=2 Tax=Halocatena pleomorpha TaxID=1785090 RepID=A0A3P3RF63_9EURY|nr:glycosyltransferase [Halocatena pleomorpha]
MRDEMEQIHGSVSNTEILPLAVDTDRFAFERNTQSTRETLDLPDRPIIVTFRRLKPCVGVDLLINAMESVVETHPDALLLIGGKGYLRETLEQQVHTLGLDENVRFLGFVPEAELPTYYAVADCSVVPTKELEGFGLSTIESLSCGTPVVATPVGANPEVLGQFDQQLVCESVSATAVATTISQFLKRDA